MNWDRIEGKWEQAKGELKTKWNKLTDDDLGSVAGKRDQLVGKLQERYGILKDDAERQIDAWVAAFDGGAEDAKAKAKDNAEDLKSKAEHTAADLKTKAEHTASDFKAKVVELKDKAMDVAQDLKSRALDVAQDAAYKVDELVAEQRQASASADKPADKATPTSAAKKGAPSPRSSNPDL